MYLSGLPAAAAMVPVVVGGRLEGGTVVMVFELVERRRRTACLGARGLEWKACAFDDGGWWGGGGGKGGGEGMGL